MCERRVLLKNALVLTLDGGDNIFSDTDVLVENGIITRIDKGIVPTERDDVTDCSGLLLCPGFVNAHLHSDENMFKGLYDNMPLELWMLYSYPPSGDYGNFSERLVYLRTLVGAIEMIRSGCTCCQDDVSGHPRTTADTHRIIFKAYEDIGMRANVSTSAMHKCFLDTIPYLRDTIPAELQAKFRSPLSADEELSEAEKIIREWNGKGLFRVTLSPIAPQRCDDEYSVRVYELAEKYDLPYHTHICETRMQRETGYEFYGKTIVSHCADLGILSPRTTIAHANWLDDEDIAIIAEAGANVVHNVVSNLKLGSGIMPYSKMTEAGVHICLGTDGTSSNDSQSILEVMKTTALIHKVTQQDYTKWPTASQILNNAVREGARSVMRESEIGSIEVGKQADIVMYDLGSYAFTPLNDVKNHLVYCENGSHIKHVMIGGRLVLRDGSFVSIDERAVLSELRSLQAEFMEKYRKTLTLSEGIFPYIDSVYRRCVNSQDSLWRYSAAKGEYALGGRHEG